MVEILGLSTTKNNIGISRDIIEQIASATGIGLVLSIIWIYAATYKLLARFLQFIRATNRYGDEDVWDYTFNSKKPGLDYIHLRDFENQIVYAGWVTVFSETEKLREIVLRDAEVWAFSGDKLFETPLIYLARPPEKIHIEFPAVPPEEPRHDPEAAAPNP